MILGITGTNGAGKGTVVEYLVEKAGFTHYSVRDEIVREILARGLEVNRPAMNEVGTDLREQHGPAYFIELFIKQAKEAGQENIAIESIRNPFEGNRLHELGGFLITVDADKEVRYERIISRRSATDMITFEEFSAQEDREMTSEDPNNPAKMNVSGVFAMADYGLTNNGTREELFAQIDHMLEKLSQ